MGVGLRGWGMNAGTIVRRSVRVENRREKASFAAEKASFAFSAAEEGRWPQRIFVSLQCHTFAPSGSLSHPPRHRCALPLRTRGPTVSAHPPHASTIATGAPPHCRHGLTGNTTTTSPSVTNTPTLYQHTAAHTLCLATLTATASATQCSHTRLKQASIQLWRAMPSSECSARRNDALDPGAPCTTIYATFVGFVLAA